MSEVKVRVAFVPIWSKNPYHQELTNALIEQGVGMSDSHELKDVYSRIQSGDEQLDVIHLHALPYFSWRPGRLARFALFYWRLWKLKRKGIRLVWTVHDFDNHDTAFRVVEEWVARRMMPLFDALIVHGESGKELIQRKWPEVAKRVNVIPHGHYIGSYSNRGARDTRSSFGLNDSHVVFLFLGLIRPYKGVLELIRAFKQCANPSARLIIAGKPVAPRAVQEIQEAIDGEDRITFVPGFVDDDEVQRFMNSCDIMVLPYKKVLTSGAAILAMSFARPCIAPNVGCIRDTLNARGALFFNPGVEGDLARAMEEAIDRRQELSAMGKYNQERVSDWDWFHIALETIRVYRRCLGEERRAIGVVPRSTVEN